MAGEYINSKAGKKRIKSSGSTEKRKMNYTLLRTLPELYNIIKVSYNSFWTIEKRNLPKDCAFIVCK